MTQTENETAAQGMPQPDPALARLEPLVGTWEMTGRTLDADEDNISGRTVFEWLPGRFFLLQRIEMNFGGLEIKSFEPIGYDAETGAFSSLVYSNLFGSPIPYRWDLRDGILTISTDLAGGATFRGTFSDDGSTFSGGWRPDEGAAGPRNVAYDVSGRRAG